jgi:uncharacterized membrane protein YhhN
MVRLLEIIPANLSLFLIPLLIAVVDWIGVAKNWIRLRFMAKPGVILALLVLLWVFTGYQGRTTWYALALVFSLAGDIFLVLPQDRFRPALLSFLLTHISYIIAFRNTPSFPILAALLLLIGLVVSNVILYIRVAEGLARAGKDKLKIMILLYQLVISIMVLCALNTLWLDNWTPTSAIWLSAGALLFFCSDSILSWNRFVRPISFGRLKLTVAYHLGQIALIIGAILHFASL